MIYLQKRKEKPNGLLYHLSQCHTLTNEGESIRATSTCVQKYMVPNKFTITDEWCPEWYDCSTSKKETLIKSSKQKLIYEQQ